MQSAQAYPSIQSFYEREVSKSAPKDSAATSAAISGDGFTKYELSDALDPSNRKWKPEHDYEELGIGDLVPGPKAVTFIGRIVNASTVYGRSQKQPKAGGWHYLILKSNTAAISIKLYFTCKAYPLILGHVLSVWTAFISDASKSGTKPIPSVFVHANLFPGRVTSDHIIIHTNSSIGNICRAPLDYSLSQPLQGLTTLKSYTSSGHDGVAGAKILACVKVIGARKKITTKSGVERELAEVLLFDHTGEIRWTLWGELIESSRFWEPGKTILLISNPGYRALYGGKGGVAIQHSTMVDVDPDFPDANWLRKYSEGLTKRESLSMEFPEGVWDVEAAESGVCRLLYTLAEVDEWRVRSEPRQVFTGYINVTILEVSLVLYHRRTMLMCTECCGVPVYANTPISSCQNCSRSLILRLNPRVIGTLLDETGCIGPGKLLWSERAWEQLLGRTIKELADMPIGSIRCLEQTLSFLRMHLVFGWEESIGRLAVLGIRM